MSPAIILKTLSSTFQRFFRMEAISGVLLIFFALFAMLWANSSWGSQYFDLWETRLSLTINGEGLSKPILLWINDGLMALFFFLVGLEIKREILAGELTSIRKALLPIFAAVGGILVPAGIFFLLMSGKAGSEGWGIPMATDIAFSLGILMLLGKKVPLSLKVFLTALAIIDDIGAVLIIAIFYSGDVNGSALLAAGALLAVLLIFNFTNIRKMWPYIFVGLGVWYFFLKSGIHPTVAGVLVALLIPANSRLKKKEFIEESVGELKEFDKNQTGKSSEFLSHQQLEILESIETRIEEVQPPLQKLEHKLHGFVAFFIMPVFALANAGVAIGGGEQASSFGWLTIAIMAGLIFGKSTGIVLFSWIGVKLGLCDLPDKADWKQIFGIGLLGGIGFTMALFISNLALNDAALLNQAKMGVIIGSIIAGTAGYFVLNYSLKKQ